MKDIAKLLEFIGFIIDSSFFLLIVFFISFILKIYLGGSIIISRIGYFTDKSKKSFFRPLLPLLGVLFCVLIHDSVWIFYLLNKIHNWFDYRILRLWVGIAWGFYIMQYQFLSVFIESLVISDYRLTFYNKLMIAMSSVLLLFFLMLSIMNYLSYPVFDNYFLRFIFPVLAALFELIPIMLVSLIKTIYLLRKYKFPRILITQLKVLILGLILPYWCFDLLQVFFVIFFPIENMCSLTSISNIFLTYAFYYSTRYVMRLRFLNFSHQVESPIDLMCMDRLKEIVGQLKHAATDKDLLHVTQFFFKNTFNIPFSHCQLYIRASYLESTLNNATGEHNDTNVPHSVETMLNKHGHIIAEILQERDLFVYDEIAFSYFYDACYEHYIIYDFMEVIHADIFIPMYDKHTIIGYIIVDRNARIDRLYSNSEYDEMIIFTQYLTNMVRILRSGNLETLLKHEKEMREEIYLKHQEINQYKESIRVLMRTAGEKNIGIIFYKNKWFSFGNEAASELVKININQSDGHPFVQELKKIVYHVEEFKTSQSSRIKNQDGKLLALIGVPSFDFNGVVILVYFLEVTDSIKKHFDLLKDPTQLDYLLYLETTEYGRLINQLIPSSEESLLNFKIDLLKTALSKKAVLLEVPENDLLPMVELLHHISLREKLQVIDLSKPYDPIELADVLFGVNHILGYTSTVKVPLLEMLDNVGTLFIKHIQLLDLELQRYMMEFIRYGVYRIYKSEQKKASDVRIICSTEQNIQQLVREGEMLQEFYEVLAVQKLVMPSLHTLSHEVLCRLIDELTQQVLPAEEGDNVCLLSLEDKDTLCVDRPTSFGMLKDRVQHILVQKSKNVTHNTDFHFNYHMFDAELAHAARLGKRALREKKIMTLLWNKFKNQNKIAQFLGVNRSSVNRRCKKFGLLVHE